ncbi:MAG: carboxypeptidase-like regulatory domain-containing protein [Alphaproteobacteria bacterium]|nr:carboxypeptidase-like regulatory domain-containing protein [Alphaproteobacteria bacterium]
MKSFSLLVILNFTFFVSFSQTYSGQIIDTESGKPIPYANIGIVGKNVGTASDANGLFKIELNSKFDQDTLGISCIGYMNRKYQIRNFKDNILIADKAKIGLSPRIYQLPDVVIKPVKIKIYTLGNYCDPGSAYGNAFYSEQIGTEIGVIIKLPRKKVQGYLQTFRFYVGEFTFEKFPVRLNIYNLKNNKPYENILTEPIYIEIKSEGEYIIDLKKYNIKLTDDFFISLEYYKIPDRNKGKLVFCATHRKNVNKGNGYFRFTSQGNWEPEPIDNVGFSVQIECEK